MNIVKLIERQRQPAEVVVAVFGTHATLSLEPVEMLQRVQQVLTLKVTFFGIEPRWCKILGMCNLGSATLTQLLRAAEEDPFAYPWPTMMKKIEEVYDVDPSLHAAELLICTEPVAGCLMLRQISAAQGKVLPMLGYFGVALFNGCPPQDVDTFWNEFATILPADAKTVLSTNNLILSEQIFYQTGQRFPYVRAHGLYTDTSYDPRYLGVVLFWRSPLYAYASTACAIEKVLAGFTGYPLQFQFVEESESIPYTKAAQYRSVAMLPHDHALMSFYELYSISIPLLMPSAEWMFRLLYMRGQLSVGALEYPA